MLREQLWSVSWGTLFRSTRGCAGSQRWGIMWSREHVLLLNNYSLGEPVLMQNNDSTFLHKVVVSCLSCMGQQDRERNGAAWWVWCTLFGDKYSKTFICFRSFALCLCISCLPAHFQALFYLYPRLLGSRKLLYLDLSIMIFSIWVVFAVFQVQVTPPATARTSVCWRFVVWRGLKVCCKQWPSTSFSSLLVLWKNWLARWIYYMGCS